MQTKIDRWNFSAFLALLGFLASTGCTSTIVLETTKDVAGHSERLNKKLAAYQGSLEKDAADRVARIASMRVRIEGLKAELDKRLAIWEIIPIKDAMRLYNGVQELETKTRAERDARKDRLERELKALRATQAKFRSQQKVLSDLARQLVALAEPPDLKAQGKYLIEFVKSVNKEQQRLEEANSINNSSQ